MKLTQDIEIAILHTAIKAAKSSPLPESVIVAALESNARCMLKDGKSEEFVMASILKSDVFEISATPQKERDGMVKCPDCGAELLLEIKFKKHHS